MDESHEMKAVALSAPNASAQTAPTEPRRSDFSEHAYTIAWRKATYYWSTVLLIFALVVTFYTIGMGWNNPPWEQSHAAVDIIVFIVLLSWIGLLEGCQISIVGLQNVDMELYKDSHPRSYKACKLAHKGPNVERFLVGRQFLLLFCGFVVSRVAGAKSDDDFKMGSWQWTPEASQVFWLNSALLMIVIIVPGQLVTQLLAADKMLGFFELPFMAYYTILLPCLFIESIGITHSSYLLKDVLCRIARIDPSEGDPSKKMKKDFLYYARVLLSITAVIFSGTFIIKGLASSQTNATHGVGWDKLPGWAAIILTGFFLFMMACAEGLQVSALALAKTPLTEIRARSPLAYRTCQLLYTGRNMQAFLIGRQTIVAMMMVLLARVTSYAGSDGELVEGSDWGMPKAFNEWFLQTGLGGAIFVVNVAQLASQVTASIFPIPLINNHVMHILLRMMLFIEFSGVVNACWPLTWAADSLLGLEKDPFDGDENVKTDAQNIMDRKKSMGIPSTKGVTPFDLHQPEQEFHMDYTYKVSYI